MDADSRHVMFVDDEPVMHRLVERGLHDAGVRLTCVSDGAQALRVLEQERVDLLITALALPVVDGIELLRHVANRRLAVPVIVATSADPPACGPGSPLCFVREPIGVEALVGLVRERLAGPPPASTVGVRELASLIALERRSCALHVMLGDFAQGVLLFANGVPVHAAFGELRGDAAARELLTASHALLRIDTHVRAREFTVASGLPGLLREAEALGDLRARAPAAASGSAPMSVGPAGEPTPVAMDSPGEPTPAGPVARVGRAGQPTPATAVAAVAAAMAPRAALGDPAGAVRSGPDIPVWERAAAQGPVAALLGEALTIAGAIGAGVGVWELAHSLGTRTSDGAPGALNMQAAVTGNSRVMRATMSTMARLGMMSAVQDVLIVLDEQMHVLTPLPRYDGLFLHIVLDREHGNLALARLQVRRMLAELRLEGADPSPAGL